MNKVQKEGIMVGNDVWIGINSIILPDIKIGDGVTIAAGSVVTKDVPEYAIVAGNPAKIIRMKHSREVIDKLKQISWWNWSVEKIKNNRSDFYLSVEKFLEKHL